MSITNDDKSLKIRRTVRRSFILAIGAFLLLEVVFAWVHEFGHGIGCLYYGLEPDIQLVIFGNSYSWCDIQDQSQALLIGLLGGIFAGAVSIGIGYLGKLKNLQWLFVAATATGVGHFVRAFLEGFFHQFYLTQQTVAGQIIGVMFGITFILMVRQFIVLPSKRQQEVKSSGKVESA